MLNMKISTPQSSPSAICNTNKAENTDKTAPYFATPDNAAFGGITFDYAIFGKQHLGQPFLRVLSEQGELPPQFGARNLLPANYSWKDATGKKCIPIQLCEFLAYKSALVYQTENTIARNIGGATKFQFFDSKNKGIADTQGCAFYFDGVVFIVMRGTENKADWRIDLNDTFTDRLSSYDKKFVSKLVKKYGAGTETVLGDIETKPGRHLGFAIGWAAVHDDIVNYLNDPTNGFAHDVPIVLSGHSLGGALAVLGAAELKNLGYNVEAVVTFGAPQAGNETFFAKSYGKDLQERTVQFRVLGDAVPQIMRGYLYRFVKWVKRSFSALFSPAAATKTDQKYQLAGTEVVFKARPMLTEQAVQDAIRNIQEQVKRAEQERTQAASKTNDSKPVSSPGSEPAAKPGAGPSNSGVPSGAVWIGLGLAGVGALAFYGYRKLSAHNMVDSYATSISTRSYQFIRSLRATEDGTLEQRLNRANRDLARYLRFVRGDTGGGAPFFRDPNVRKPPIADLPVRLNPGIDIETLRAHLKIEL